MRAPSPLLAFVPKGGDDLRGMIGGLVHRLEAAQWRVPEEIAGFQHRALAVVSEHAAVHSPFFAGHLRAAGLSAADLATPEGLVALPPMTRRDYQRPADEIYCRAVPPDHGEVGEGRSSGSTGEPVVIRRTLYNDLLYRALSVRLNLWHDLGTGRRMGASRATATDLAETDCWTGAAGLFWPTGPMLTLPNGWPIAEQAGAMSRFAPDILLAYPSVLVALARMETSLAPRQVRSIGETLSAHDRAAVAEAWGCAVIDIYSSEEAGYIALQCPDGDFYHVMSETLIVEVVDEAGRPCDVGETGRVLVTDLNNYATPMVRYAIGDFAEVGPPCPCGRGLPTLRRIAGRERNLVRMPDGSRHWPRTGRDRFRSIAPVAQYQMIQRATDRIEARLVVERPLVAGEEAQLRTVMQEAIGHPFAIDLVYFDGRLPTGKNGKFEEFVCLV